MRKLLISKVILVKKIYFNLKHNNRIIILLLILDYINILMNISYITMLLSVNKLLKILFIVNSINFFKRKMRNLYTVDNCGILSLLNIKYVYAHEINMDSGNNYDISIFPISMILKPFSIYEIFCSTVGGGVVLGMVSHKIFNNRIFKKVLVNYKNQLFFQIIFSLIKYCGSLILFKCFYIYQYKNIFFHNYTTAINLKDTKLYNNLFFRKYKITGRLLKKCKSFDQVKTIIILTNTSLKNSNCFLFINSIKGRGKSALLGFFISIGIYFGLKYILVSSKLNSNFYILAHFLFFALKIIGFKENIDFVITFQKLLYNSNFNFIFKSFYLKKIEFRKSIKKSMSKNLDLLVIDDENLEQILKNILNVVKFKIFLSFSFNTFNFYEYLFSYKMYFFLNNVTAYSLSNNTIFMNKSSFKRIMLKTPIPYNMNDKIEKWLTKYIFFSCYAYCNGFIKTLKNTFKLWIFFMKKIFILNFFSKINVFLLNLSMIFYNNQTRYHKLVIFEALKKNAFIYLLSISNKVFSKNIYPLITGLLFFYNVEKVSKAFNFTKKKNKAICNQDRKFNFGIFFTFCFKIIEIKNIVIHPNFQNLGYGEILKIIGSRLLNLYNNLNYFCINKVSCRYLKPTFLYTIICVSFYLKLKYYCFWFKNGFNPVNLAISYIKDDVNVKVTMLKVTKYNRSIIRKIIHDYFLDFNDRLIFFAMMKKYHLSPMNFITMKISISQHNMTFRTVNINKINNISIQTFNFLDLIKIFSFFKGIIQLHTIQELFTKLSFFYFNNTNICVISYSELLIIYLFGIQKKTLVYIKEYLKLNYYNCCNLIKKAYLKIVFRLIETFLFIY